MDVRDRDLESGYSEGVRGSVACNGKQVEEGIARYGGTAVYVGLKSHVLEVLFDYVDMLLSSRCGGVMGTMYV